MYDNLRNTNNRAKRRCKKCHHIAAYYCAACTVFDNNVNPITILTLCGTMTGRSCFHDHCKEVYSGQEDNFIHGVNERTPAANIPDLQRRRLS
jgi:hypothetical protein